MLFDSATLAVVRPTMVKTFTVALAVAEMRPFAAIVILSPANVGNNAITFDWTLAFVKYKLPAVSITFAVYKLCHVVDEILPAVTFPVVTILFEFKLMLLAVILTLPAALILKSDVDAIDPEPVAVDINVFAKTLPVNLMLPPETILKSPVAFNVPVPGAVDIKLFAITLPALILPVYVVRKAPTLAVPNVPTCGFAARYAVTFDNTRAFV